MILVSWTETGRLPVKCFHNLTILIHSDRMIYDVDFQDMADTPLSDVGLKAGTILRITNDDGDEIDLNMDAM